MADQISVLGIAGSLRQGSYNKAALRAAIELAPAGMIIEAFDLAPIQLYNEDVKQQGFPPPEQEFRDKIRAADALLIVTPEYNRGTSGVLKNAIDWASRPPDQPFSGKPAAILGASPGAIGTAVAQYELRRYLGVLNALVLNTPSVMIGQAVGKVRRAGPADRPADPGDHRPAARRARRLDPSAPALAPAKEADMDEQAAAGTMLLTVFLKHRQSMNLAEINQRLEATGFWQKFPPDGVEVVSWYVMMGIGQVVTLKLPAGQLRAVNLAIEQNAWGAFETEFYPTYDYRPIWQGIKERA